MALDDLDAIQRLPVQLVMVHVLWFSKGAAAVATGGGCLEDMDLGEGVCREDVMMFWGWRIHVRETGEGETSATLASWARRCAEKDWLVSKKSVDAVAVYAVRSASCRHSCWGLEWGGRVK